ncbi:hypothetical protein NJB1907f44_35260 [Mycobacterium marinum]|nr:hypothetical protein NJB1907f34b_18260 [Mycobacterium marinum]GJO07471.1 hypothetical protein NJB1907E90_20740 [Mycobacterium marinum]GJO15741.1 hypothetical protein NJB1907E11_14930 [Mycobacterium marinum]GJO21020.1 hypothetical protein NJB1728e18_21280 [Mycobacterium marinum]GJO28951.1 hypothetical protein NJB1907f22_23210 [Mycobacterium marinum]
MGREDSFIGRTTFPNHHFPITGGYGRDGPGALVAGDGPGPRPPSPPIMGHLFIIGPGAL